MVQEAVMKERIKYRIWARERKKEKRRLARKRREIRKIARRIDDPTIFGL